MDELTKKQLAKIKIEIKIAKFTLWKYRLGWILFGLLLIYEIIKLLF